MFHKNFFSRELQIKMDIRPNIRIKVVLMKKGLTQRDLAFGTAMAESKISSIIKGYQVPTSQMKKAIAQFLGMRIEHIFED